MILVDLELPALGRLYQFNLDETVPVSQLMEEIVGVIYQKEQNALVGNADELMLCSIGKESVLNPDKSLSEQQIGEADRLILI